MEIKISRIQIFIEIKINILTRRYRYICVENKKLNY